MGLCSTMARVAGILAPLIIPLDQYNRAIPLAIFGSIPVVVALFCLLLPETRGIDLTDGTANNQSPVEVQGTLEIKEKKISKPVNLRQRKNVRVRDEYSLISSSSPLSFLASGAEN